MGTTLKYVRGTLRHGREDSLAPPSELLGLGDEYEHGDAQNRFDLDVGLLAVAGPVRLGAVVKNVREPEFDAPGLTPDAESNRMVLPRQIRVGVAFDPENATGVPLTVALDADVRSYSTPSGERRMVALGVEHWFLTRRLGVRAGGRSDRRRRPCGHLAAALVLDVAAGRSPRLDREGDPGPR